MAWSIFLSVSVFICMRARSTSCTKSSTLCSSASRTSCASDGHASRAASAASSWISRRRSSSIALQEQVALPVDRLGLACHGIPPFLVRFRPLRCHSLQPQDDDPVALELRVVDPQAGAARRAGPRRSRARRRRRSRRAGRSRSRSRRPGARPASSAASPASTSVTTTPCGAARQLQALARSPGVRSRSVMPRLARPLASLADLRGLVRERAEGHARRPSSRLPRRTSSFTVVPGLLRGDVAGQVAVVADRAPVGREDHVLGLEARPSRPGSRRSPR